jgi:peptidoglycan/LPS O-acetylase OafA/YrhL
LGQQFAGLIAMLQSNQRVAGRFNVLDSWRGIAAVCVALFHFQGPSHLLAIPLVKNGFLFVDFFFVLSGFVISHAYSGNLSTASDFKSFAIRRFGRVWPLHLAVLAGFIAIQTLKYVLAAGAGVHTATLAFDPAGATALSALPSHVLLLHGLGLNSALTWNGPSWSISSEFWTYLVFGAVVLLFNRHRNLVFAGLAMLGAGIVAAYSVSGIDVTYSLGWPRCIFGFFIGCLTYSARGTFGGFPLMWARAAEVGMLAAVACFVAIAGRSSLSLAAPLVFATAVYVFSQQAGPVSRILERPVFQKLGQWSYSIYMLHYLVVFAMGLAVSALQRKFGFQLWHEIKVGDATDPILVSDHKIWLDVLHLIYIGTAIALARWTYRTIEMPGQRIIRTAARVQLA